MNNKKYNTASDVYRAIVNDSKLKDFTVVIAGEPGPTGKTTLCKVLVGAGVRAIDISEVLDNHVEYLCKYENDVDVDWENKIVLVILNRYRSNNE